VIPSVRLATVARDLGAQQFRLLMREYEGSAGASATPPRAPVARESEGPSVVEGVGERVAVDGEDGT
jgi:hypothetical protein